MAGIDIEEDGVESIGEDESSDSGDEKCACTIEQLAAYIVFGAGLCAACAFVVAAMLYIYKH